MTILDQTRVLRVLSETRDRLRALQAVRRTDDIVTGEGLTEAIDILDDAMVEEVRGLNAADASETSEAKRI